MEDTAIVDLYWQRSDRAIAETEKKYGAYCRCIAYNICGSPEDAEECVNDTWIGAWSAMPTERPSRLAAFLGCLTRNAAIGRYRLQHRQKRGAGETTLALEELSECLPGGGEPERALERKELETLIRAFVGGLEKTEQTVFTARYYYVFPVKEIATRLNLSESKVKSMLFRLRERLRRALEKEGYC
ncbi:MAG: sigma-70 family RNA polymerase sigma factor [Oscillospiraceae bacterium]|nr:sigma-70 family RNA polymerase sigma factor [Oscillospiraceae bacterium]